MAAADGGRRVRRVDPADPSQWNLSSMRALCGPASSASQRSAAQAASVESQARTAAGASSSRAMAASPADAAYTGSGVFGAAGASSSWAPLSAVPADLECIGSRMCSGAGVSSSGALAELAAHTERGAPGAHGSRADGALAQALPAPSACSDAILSGSAAPPLTDATILSDGGDQIQAAGACSGRGPASSIAGRHAMQPEPELLAGSRGQRSTDMGPAAAGPPGAGAAGGAPDTGFWVDPYVGGFALRPRARADPSSPRIHAPAAATEASIDAVQADSAPRQRTGAPSRSPLVAKLEQGPVRRAAVGYEDCGASDIAQLFEGMDDGEDF